ncbi:FKBP-like protein [Hysterangium stoloniferum]|nr:FKBP-like protein [Hysterangium stoloniferum]
MVVLAAWSAVIGPGKRLSQEVYRDFKITNAALGAALEDPKARSTLKIIYSPPPLSDDEDDDGPSKKAKTKEVALCSLTPGTIEQATLDITFIEDDIIEFEVVGKNSIHLFGNYIGSYHQTPISDFPPDDYDSDEESVNLLDVSSDVEINPDELDDLADSDDEEYVADRFEEIDDEKPATGKKHARDDGDVSMISAVSGGKANKKLKAETGSAVPVSTEGAIGDKKKEKKKKEKKGKEGKADASADAPAATSSPDKEKTAKKSGSLQELSGGLKIRDMTVGTGKQAKAGNTVSMRYIGKLENGKIFDSNTKGKPFTFRLGKGEVIKGWDQGVAGMQVGGERLLIIPPALAYGKQSQSGIPANSTLKFECKLVEIK